MTNLSQRKFHPPILSRWSSHMQIVSFEIYRFGCGLVAYVGSSVFGNCANIHWTVCILLGFGRRWTPRWIEILLRCAGLLAGKLRRYTSESIYGVFSVCYAYGTNQYKKLFTHSLHMFTHVPKNLCTLAFFQFNLPMQSCIYCTHAIMYFYHLTRACYQSNRFKWCMYIIKLMHWFRLMYPCLRIIEIKLMHADCWIDANAFFWCMHILN
jgi:hypothetical protein